ncbi:hypothetical protein Tco_1030001 [Tanacetum coccineum]|uniref:Uncharacterized protein n=1 Tax=Tanacetum coccineum TaxID=301880 RepID=A0ABQ5G4Z6_9ASTR
MYGHGYAWDLRKLGKVLNVSSKGTLFFTKSTDTKAIMKLKNYHPSSFACEPSFNSIMIHDTIMRPEFHCEGIPSKSWEKHQLHPYLNAWADVLSSNMLSGLDYNNEALPYARVMTTLFEYLKNKHPNDASRMIEVEEVSSICPPFTMESLKL